MVCFDHCVLRVQHDPTMPSTPQWMNLTTGEGNCVVVCVFVCACICHRLVLFCELLRFCDARLHCVERWLARNVSLALDLE